VEVQDEHEFYRWDVYSHGPHQVAVKSNTDRAFVFAASASTLSNCWSVFSSFTRDTGASVAASA